MDGIISSCTERDKAENGCETSVNINNNIVDKNEEGALACYATFQHNLKLLNTDEENDILESNFDFVLGEFDQIETTQKQLGQNLYEQKHTNRKDSHENTEKLHSCHLCNELFLNDVSFRLHLRKHGQQTRYNCDQCEKPFFPTSTKLWQHIGKKHIKSKHHFSCSLCMKTFSEGHNFHLHMLIHLGERPEKCHHCDKSFRTKPSLAKHILSHSSKKLFACDVCAKAFKTKDELKQHAISHTTGKPFHCDHCRQAFKYEASMKRHMKKGRCQLGLHWVPLRKKIYKKSVTPPVFKSIKNISNDELAKDNLKTMHITNINVKNIINETIDKLDAKEKNDGQKLADYQNTSDFISLLDNPIFVNNQNLSSTPPSLSPSSLSLSSRSSSFTDEDSDSGYFQCSDDSGFFNINVPDFELNSIFSDILVENQSVSTLLDIVNVV